MAGQSCRHWGLNWISSVSLLFPCCLGADRCGCLTVSRHCVQGQPENRLWANEQHVITHIHPVCAVAAQTCSRPRAQCCFYMHLSSCDITRACVKQQLIRSATNASPRRWWQCRPVISSDQAGSRKCLLCRGMLMSSDTAWWGQEGLEQ